MGARPLPCRSASRNPDYDDILGGFVASTGQFMWTAIVVVVLGIAIGAAGSGWALSRFLEGLEVPPVTPDRWDDLADLAGGAGLHQRLLVHVVAGDVEGVRRAPRRRPAPGPPPARGRGPGPGLLAYVDGVPAGWVAVAPRDEYPRLDRSPKLRRLDDRPVWSITCFTIDRRHRRGAWPRRFWMPPSTSPDSAVPR